MEKKQLKRMMVLWKRKKHQRQIWHEHLSLYTTSYKKIEIPKGSPLVSKICKSLSGV